MDVSPVNLEAEHRREVLSATFASELDSVDTDLTTKYLDFKLFECNEKNTLKAIELTKLMKQKLQNTFTFIIKNKYR